MIAGTGVATSSYAFTQDSKPLTQYWQMLRKIILKNYKFTP